MSSPIALILGAGSRVGQSVAFKLKQEGYKVAVASRNPKVAEAEQNGFLPISVDVQDSPSIINAFKVVHEKYGAHPNVVVFNAASLVQPLVAGDPLTIPLSAIQDTVNLEVGLFASAQQALSGFRELAKAGNKLPKLFIFTGNPLPWFPVAGTPWTNFASLALQKRTGAFFIELFASSYESEGFRFYFADQSKEDGGLLDGDEFSGDTHAIAYLDLVNKKEQGHWYYRFGKDGKQLPGRDKL